MGPQETGEPRGQVGPRVPGTDRPPEEGTMPPKRLADLRAERRLADSGDPGGDDDPISFQSMEDRRQLLRATIEAIDGRRLLSHIDEPCLRSDGCVRHVSESLE